MIAYRVLQLIVFAIIWIISLLSKLLWYLVMEDEEGAEAARRKQPGQSKKELIEKFLEARRTRYDCRVDID